MPPLSSSADAICSLHHPCRRRTSPQLRPNITVALDGTEDFRSIAEAVRVIPNNSDSIFYVYVKAGKYFENIYIDGEKRNIIMYGDGIGKTNIISSRSNSTGYSIGESAALTGDYIVCLRCSIEGFQDTLYAHRGKSQFFFKCDIFGTIDFIFGDARMIVQNSIIHVRRPSDGQQNMITADGRHDATLNTAIVIHNCSIIPTPELSQSNVKTYLGRPWKRFARTIIMQSYLDKFIDPEGWAKFSDKTDVTTLYYAEFWNYGPGSNTSGRVKWPGYHALNNPDDVQDFLVKNFIDENDWLSKFDVPFFPGLVK
ncbi:hypothetical protein Ddye_026702 [Dipteronia dyeriana]|uniref:Pectinesterase n=1 Tax=Dipteronia dyeriana TaxID=168575 RepID=A0AAD9TN79_9ROSI|nr:hypothetical protein Ddye_026702 [Dipteronia dyeriana]